MAVFSNLTDPKELAAIGRRLRTQVPRQHLARHERRPGAQAVDIVVSTNADRVPELVPLRMGRMAASPFAFMRGAAAVMAHDLDAGPASSGLDAQICGDAHLCNFGFFASPERRQVMDLNDFDETVVGPFEYDLKRLVASIAVAAKERGIPAHACADAVYDGVKAYRGMTNALAKMPVQQAWALGFDHHMLTRIRVGHLVKVLARVQRKAAANDSSKVARKMTKAMERTWQFDDVPPVLRRLQGAERDQVIAGLEQYVETIPPSRAVLLSRYLLADLAFRVVGVGSVGTRAYIALLHGTSEDPFVLQIKEARASVFAGSPRCRTYPADDGQRVVFGQLIMQTVSDPMLGWTSVAGRSSFVRTFRDLKGSIDVNTLKPNQLDDYARLCGALLARAHARSLDSHVLIGYLGSGEELAECMVRYAMAYAEQTEQDYLAFIKQVEAGRIPVTKG